MAISHSSHSVDLRDFLPILRRPLVVHLGIFDAFLESVKVKLPVHMVELELVRQFTAAVLPACAAAAVLPAWLSHFVDHQSNLLVQLCGRSHLLLDQEFESWLQVFKFIVVKVSHVPVYEARQADQERAGFSPHASLTFWLCKVHPDLLANINSWGYCVNWQCRELGARVVDAKGEQLGGFAAN